MLVSVIMAVYNKEKYVLESINSILNQSYKELELIIVDDCSTDNSRKIIEEIKDERIKKYNLKENMGISKAINFAIDKSKGNIIVRMDADDIAELNRIEKLVQVMEERKYDAIGSCFEVISEYDIPMGLKRYEELSNSIIETKDIIDKITIIPTVLQPTMAYKRQVLVENKYDANLKTAEDYAHLANLIIQGYKIGKVEEKLFKYRYLPVSLSNTKAQEGVINSLKIKLEYIDKLKSIGNYKKIYVWGTKEFASYLRNLLKDEYNREIEGFVDFNENIQINLKDGIKVLNENEFNKEVSDIDLVLTIWNIQRDEISDYLNNIGLKLNENYFVLS